MSAETLCLLALAVLCVLPAFMIEPDDDDPSHDMRGDSGRNT